MGDSSWSYWVSQRRGDCKATKPENILKSIVFSSIRIELVHRNRHDVCIQVAMRVVFRLFQLVPRGSFLYSIFRIGLDRIGSATAVFRWIFEILGPNQLMWWTHIHITVGIEERTERVMQGGDTYRRTSDVVIVEEIDGIEVENRQQKCRESVSPLSHLIRSCRNCYH